MIFLCDDEVNTASDIDCMASLRWPRKWPCASKKAFGPDMDHLLRMQLACAVAKTRQHSGNIVIKRYVPARQPTRLLLYSEFLCMHPDHSTLS